MICFAISGPIYKEKEQEKAIKQTEHYLAENYQDLKYEIQSIDSSTDFKHYGYFKHNITVQNAEMNYVFQEKSI